MLTMQPMPQRSITSRSGGGHPLYDDYYDSNRSRNSTKEKTPMTNGPLILHIERLFRKSRDDPSLQVRLVPDPLLKLKQQKGESNGVNGKADPSSSSSSPSHMVTGVVPLQQAVQLAMDLEKDLMEVSMPSAPSLSSSSHSSSSSSSLSQQQYQQKQQRQKQQQLRPQQISSDKNDEEDDDVDENDENVKVASKAANDEEDDMNDDDIDELDDDVDQALRLWQQQQLQNEKGPSPQQQAQLPSPPPKQQQVPTKSTTNNQMMIPVLTITDVNALEYHMHKKTKAKTRGAGVAVNGGTNGTKAVTTSTPPSSSTMAVEIKQVTFKVNIATNDLKRKIAEIRKFVTDRRQNLHCQVTVQARSWQLRDDPQIVQTTMDQIVALLLNEDGDNDDDDDDDEDNVKSSSPHADLLELVVPPTIADPENKPTIGMFRVRRAVASAKGAKKNKENNKKQKLAKKQKQQKAAAE
jgi:translation initiation factor IF-3